MNITVQYYTRGKCHFCQDIMWTTDKICSVRCLCNKSLLTPQSDLDTQPTDIEQKNYVINELNLSPLDEISLTALFNLSYNFLAISSLLVKDSFISILPIISF